MLDNDSYANWTKVFNPGGSYFKGDWSKGSKMLFIGPDPETGKEGGMVSRVADNRQYEFVSIEHVGMVADGKEDTTSEMAKKWTPGFENYTFTEKDGVTTVRVDIDLAEEFVDMFNDVWPQALATVKEMAEK